MLLCINQTAQCICGNLKFAFEVSFSFSLLIVNCALSKSCVRNLQKRQAYYIGLSTYLCKKLPVQVIGKNGTTM
jgi:hypothetical protein